MIIGLYDTNYPDEGPLWAGRLDRIEGNVLYGDFVRVLPSGRIYRALGCIHEIDILDGEVAVRL